MFVATDPVTPRAQELARAARVRIARRTDRLFVGLLLGEWLALIGLSLCIAPLAWTGSSSVIHPHVWAALILGFIAVGPPIVLGMLAPGRVWTRHAVAIGQMSTSALLIHLTGGRIETHFHVFGSLAFLAFYRDWRIILTASLFTILDHMLRGFFWPESAYGVTINTDWRWLEHAGWVVFIDIFLIYSCVTGEREFLETAQRQDEIESSRAGVEREIQHRTLELQESEVRFRMLFEANPIPMWVYSLETQRLLAINSAAMKQYGYSKDEFLALSLQDFAETRPAIPQAGSPKLWQLRRRDGIWIEAEVSLSDIRDGRELARLVAAVDVSDRVRAESERQRVANLLKAVADGTPDAVFIKDRQGRYMLFNTAAAGFVGKPVEEVLGRDDTELFPPAEAEMVMAHDRRVMELGQAETTEEQLTAAGVRRTYLATKSPYRGPDGSIVGVIGISRDITDRKQAEDEVRRNEAQFRGAFDDTGVAMVLMDIQHHFLRANTAFADLFGYRPEEMLGMSLNEITHPANATNSFGHREDLLAGKVSYYQIERQYIHRKGQTVWGLTNVSLVRDPSGKPFLYVTQVQDITERKEAEAALRQSERALRDAQRLGQLGSWEWDLSSPEPVWSEEVYRIFGLSTDRASPSGAALHRPNPLDLCQNLSATVAKVLQSGEPTQQDFEITGVAGVRRWVVCRGEPVLDQYGEIVSFRGTIQDVTDLKRADEALRMQHAFFQCLAESSPDGILVVGPDHRILTYNRRFLELWHIPEEMARDGDDLPVLRYARSQTTDPDAFSLRVAEIHSEPDKPSHDEFKLTDGRTLERYSGPLRGPKSEMLGRVWYFRDISERKRLEAQFRQVQKMEAVGQLAGGVAHDFNNLLTIINGYSEILLMSLPEQDQCRELVSEILHAGNRSAALTRQLLAFSRQQVLTLSSLDLNTVVVDTDKMLRRLIGEDISLTTIPGRDLWKVRADPGQVEQVLMNLAVNARDAMPTGGHLTIETRNVELDEAYTLNRTDARTGPHVLLAVSDSGGGMPPEVLARIFEPFYSTKGPGKGTGLGLATVHGIIRQSGGHVTAYSEMGVGTTFKVYLPRVDDPTTTTKPESETRPARGTERILVVEDDHAVRALTTRILIECGYEVLEASNGEEAIRKACDAAPDLLITDVVMPGVGGRAVADQISQNHPTVKVLYVSGYTDDAVVRHGVLHEGVHFLQKPFPPNALAIKVRDILDLV